ncbi:hypothetical protein M7784_08060 [Desulfovibrio aminophilus]|nr:DVU0524 family FlgM-associated protein [Desulfovibrio aminophilus]MCM0755201.1 hypothetical protein [Desulfovibrio aminophilus]
MLRTYGKQLSNAKRLARFRRALRLSEAQDVVDISRQAKRRELVERIAREIMENLIVNSAENPVVEDILDRLEAETGWPVVLEYPLDGGELRILRQAEDGPESLGPEETARVMRRLWEITLAKVDETML